MVLDVLVRLTSRLRELPVVLDPAAPPGTTQDHADAAASRAAAPRSDAGTTTTS
jgi:hypothetical protein